MFEDAAGTLDAKDAIAVSDIAELVANLLD
jgi:hypothetical protein